jgi:hypothetical protein
MGDEPMKLWKLAKVIRSKNSGPFELTLDIIFEDDEAFRRAKKSGAITSEAVAKLYGLNEPDAVKIIEFEPANAIKATFPRRIGSGSFGDTDIYGAQQHAPLFDIEIEGSADV